MSFNALNSSYVFAFIFFKCPWWCFKWKARHLVEKSFRSTIWEQILHFAAFSSFWNHKAEWNENFSRRFYVWLFLSVDEAPNEFGRSIGETQRSPLVRKQGVSFRVISGLCTHFPYTRNVLKFRQCDNKPESIPLEFATEFLHHHQKPLQKVSWKNSDSPSIH